MAWQRIVIVKLVGMGKMAEVLAPRLFPKAEHAALKALFIERWMENDKASYLASLRAILDWEGAPGLEAMAIPTLVVSGDEDYSPVAAKEAYVRRMQNARLVVIEDSRHVTPVDQPERLNAEIEAFLMEPLVG